MADENGIDLISDISNGDLDAGLAPAAPAPAGTVPAHGKDAVPQHAQTRTDTQSKTADKPSSLRDQLSSAFKGEQPAAVDRGDGRTADGKFAPKTTEQTTEQPVQAPEGQQPPAAPQAVQPPQGLSPAEAQQFAALPAEMQQYVARTMATVEQAAARYSGYEQLEQVIAPRRQAWAINGVSEAQAVNQLLALSDFAGKSPSDFVQWFAGQHGIDLAGLSAGSDSDEYIDPAVAELRQQVADLTGQLTGITQGQHAAQHQSLVDYTSQYIAETGTDGQPLRPYFAELGSGIVPYIQQVKAENPAASHKEVLDQAYERACWANPQVRGKLLAAEEAKRLAAQRERAGRAADASSSVTGQAPSAGSTQPKDIGNGSVRDTLRAAIQQHSI